VVLKSGRIELGGFGVSIEELKKYSGYTAWIDVYKGWDTTL
jgi:hypothetical protein